MKSADSPGGGGLLGKNYPKESLMGTFQDVVCQRSGCGGGLLGKNSPKESLMRTFEDVVCQRSSSPER
jgi:hypothetical protein